MDEKKPEPLRGRDAKDTTEDAPTTPPETKHEAEEKETTRDFRLIPGGRRGSNEPIGMSAMERDDVPSGGKDPWLTDPGDSPESA